jgi:hypothetical protein
MADQTTSQLHNVQAFWKKAFDESMTRATAFYGEMAKVDAKGTEQAGHMVDEMAKLTKESIAYASALGAEWRRASLDAMKKSTELFTAGQ